MANRIRFQLDTAEVKVLAMMAENELFRIRFINPRFPHYEVDTEAVKAAQAVTARLTEAMKSQREFPVSAEKLKEMREESA